jgi:hypothetical protein
MKKLVLALSAVALSAPVLADPPSHAPAHGRRAKERAYYADQYYRPGNYPVRSLSAGDPIYRGQDGRYYCRRSDGTTGLIIGGIAGGALGNVLAPGGSKTLGTIAGAGVGALLGRAIDRGEVKCR